MNVRAIEMRGENPEHLTETPTYIVVENTAEDCISVWSVPGAEEATFGFELTVSQAEGLAAELTGRVRELAQIEGGSE